MRLRPPLAVAAGGTILVAAVLAAGGSAQPPGARTLTFTEIERGSMFGFVDNPPRARQRMGFPSGFRSATSFRSRSGSEGKTGSPPAPFALQVPVRFADTVIVGAITGGTGAYIGARGTFTSTGGDDRPSVDTCELLP